MKITQEQNVNVRLSDAHVRLMSHNVFLFDNPPIKDRSVYFLQEVELVAPDVILLQEASEPWHIILPEPMAERGFAFVPVTNANYEGALQKNNYNPIIYNTERLELVDHFQFRYSTYRPVTLNRVFTCGVFKDKVSDKKFACMSTHFTASKHDPGDFRITEASELVSEGTLKVLEKHGNIPTILMGDLNSEYGSAPLRKLGEKMICVRDIENVITNNTDIGTTHYHWGELPTKELPIIDFAFLAGEGYVAKQYQHIVNEISVTASDHIAIALDIELN